MSGYVIWNREYGYYTGFVLRSREYCLYYPTGDINKYERNVKVYKSLKRATTAAEELVKKCEYFNDYEIIEI